MRWSDQRGSTSIHEPAGGWLSSLWLRILAAAGLLGGLLSAGLLSASAASASTVVPCTGPGGGAAGLVAAINAGNAHGGGIIDLAPGCVYRVATRNNTTDNGNGLPVIRAPIIIHGNGSTIERPSTAIDKFRLFEVVAGGSLSLDRVTVTGGDTMADVFPGGGAIYNAGGNLLLTNSRLTANTSLEGAGLLDEKRGNAAVVNSRIDHNKAVVPAESIRVIGGGGAEVIDSSLTMTGSTVANNFATNFGGGIEMAGGGGNRDFVALSSSSVSNNTSDGNDGGIGVFAGSLSLGGTSVIGNKAFDDGGIDVGFFATAMIQGGEVAFNTASAPDGVAQGGGISNFGHQMMRVTGTRIHDNIANGQTAEAGGILNIGALTVSNSSIFHNATTATAGTAMGGGIANREQPSVFVSGVMTLTNSSVTDNTVSGTTGSLGGGIFNGHVVTLQNTPVTNNHPNNCRPAGSVPGCTG